MKRSKKGKFPWIEYNGEHVADSQFCIEYLNSKFSVDLNKNFSPRERGVARAFQKMIEECAVVDMCAKQKTNMEEEYPQNDGKQNKEPVEG